MKGILWIAVVGFGLYGNPLDDPVRHEGNMTSRTELESFKAHYDAGREPYRSRGEDVAADAALPPDSIRPGLWEHDTLTAVCEPRGEENAPGSHRLQETAADVWAQVLAGAITGDERHFQAARLSLLEFAATRGFEREDGGNPYSGANQCVLDLAAGVFHLVEAALALENLGYTGWTLSDRSALQTWLMNDVFDLVSWPIDARKNNWGVLGLGSAAAIATYVDFCSPLVDWAGVTWSPASYLDAVTWKVQVWASPFVPLDSTCAELSAPYGYQASGALPDEQRRGPGNDLTECRTRKMEELCTDSTRCHSGHLYSLKTLNALTRLAELMRRQGDTRLFREKLGAGVDLRGIFDYVTGGGGTFDRIAVLKEFSSFAYVLGRFYRFRVLRQVRFESGTSTRGGRDYAYGSITHGDWL